MLSRHFTSAHAVQPRARGCSFSLLRLRSCFRVSVSADTVLLPEELRGHALKIVHRAAVLVLIQH